jgi:hypothetical protein
MYPRATPLLLACGLALAAHAQAPAPKTFSKSLEAGKVHEECVRLEKGSTRRYEWKSSAKMDFNIHYHEGQEVFYPTKRDDVGKGRGRFKAKVAQDYCWMWTAKAAATLEGRIW